MIKYRNICLYSCFMTPVDIYVVGVFVNNYGIQFLILFCNYY